MTDAEKYHRILQLMADNPDMFEGCMEIHRDKFLEWLPDNIHVVSAFGKWGVFLKEKGNREYYSAYCIRERLRWDSLLEEVGTEFKLSNNITPYVARLIMKMDHRLEGMFRTKGSSDQMDEPNMFELEGGEYGNNDCI